MILTQDELYVELVNRINRVLSDGVLALSSFKFTDESRNS